MHKSQHAQAHRILNLAHHGFFELVGFYTANEERLTHTERPHQQLQGSFELTAQSRRALSRLNTLQTHTSQIVSDSFFLQVKFDNYQIHNKLPLMVNAGEKYLVFFSSK